MGHAAIDGLGDALDFTTDRLWPPDSDEWRRLLVVLVALGQAGGIVLTALALAPLAVGELLGLQTAGVVATLAVALGGSLVLMALMSIADFVLIAGLERGRVEIRADARRYLRHGLWLFGFRIALAVGASIVAILPYALVFAGVAAGVRASGALFMIVWPVVMIAMAPISLVRGFTREFVVPIMIADDCGPITGWRRLLGSIQDSLAEYGLYVGVMLVVTPIGNLVRSTVLWTTVAVLAVPLVIGAIALGHATTIALALGAAYLILALIVLAIVVATVEVPVEVFLRSYALAVLGSVSPEYDLLDDPTA